jgi:spore germination cell wall hydrolase CwlJ-like protein
MKNHCLTIIVLIIIICTMAVAEEIPPPVRGYEEGVVAMTILGEARGEGKAGMYAVACVLKQRSINRKLTPTQVCLQNRIVKGKRIHQFSCWNYTSLVGRGRNKSKLKGLLNTNEGVYAKYLAKNIHNLKRDYVKNADHYCTLKTQNYWTRKSKPVKIIGNHKFFKLR